MGLRQDRMADAVRDLLAGCFLGGQMNDPRIQGVTITAVKISADLQIATVYYRLFNDEGKSTAQVGLESCAGFLRKKLAGNLDVRRVPELRFFYDKSVDNGSRIEELLGQLKKSEY